MTEKVTSKTLEMLDKLGVQYEISRNEAYLLEHDSLKIQLQGKFKDSWKRWATGDSGRDYKSLISYLLKLGMITRSQASVVGNDDILGKEVEVENIEPYDFTTFVVNPNTAIVTNYLNQKRKINKQLIEALYEKGKLVQDGRDNARFLWRDSKGKLVGSEVQGTTLDFETFGKRGTLKHILPGSKGVFYLTTKDIQVPKEADTIIFFEAPIDLISYVEMLSMTPEMKAKIPYQTPSLRPKSLFVSLSGVNTKLPVVLNYLNREFEVNYLEKDFVSAADNDEYGLELFQTLNEVNPGRVQRDIPNDGVETTSGIVKDWNDLLKLIKGGDK